MDKDAGGSITLDEPISSYDTQSDFREILDIMDITREDLRLVFTIMDKDQSGDVNYEEFVEQLETMKNQNSHTLIVFIRHYTETIKHMMEGQQRLLARMKQSFCKMERTASLAHQVSSVVDQ